MSSFLHGDLWRLNNNGKMCHASTFVKNVLFQRLLYSAHLDVILPGPDPGVNPCAGFTDRLDNDRNKKCLKKF